MWTLAEFGDSAIAPLLNAFGSANPDVIVEALDRIGWAPDETESAAHYWTVKRDWDKCIAIGPAAIVPLIAALNDEEAEIRCAAAGALDALGWKPGSDRDGALYWIVQDRLEQCIEIGDPAVGLLINLLQNRRVVSRKRRAAAHALGEIGDARAVEPLIALLSNWEADLDMRRTAAEALVALYTGGRLQDAHKKNILALRDTIVSGHHDVHTDVSSPGNCADYHVDAAMGIDFPL